MRPAYSVTTVRAAEAALMRHEHFPDELMRLAATAVAGTAQAMLASSSSNRSPAYEPGPRVLVLAGPGGNGGDGMYAASFLQQQGESADVALVSDNCHANALAACRDAGCAVFPVQECTAREGRAYDLIIDGIAGLASARPIDEHTEHILDATRRAGGLVLAIDMPTGIDARTGVAASRCVVADATITFGWARTGHVFAPECGQVVISDLQLPGGPVAFSQALADAGQAEAYLAYEPNEACFTWPTAPLVDDERGLVTAPKPVGCTGPLVDPTPGIHATKYTGGVTTLCAGSSRYIGAGILSTGGAVNATPAMVQVVGQPEIVHHHPEVVRFDTVADARRTQSWVIGPGRGTDDQAAAELNLVLARREPTIIDADALRIIAHDESIRDAVRAHPFVVLTPHYGEFTALYESCVGPLPQEVGRAQLMSDLAQALDCFVMLKGRITHVTAPGVPVYGVNAGHSYAATPGSGDVLSGILGAVLAQQFFLAETEQLSKREIDTAIMEILHANSLHIHASLEAARTPHGMAIATASRIADAIPAALAKLLTMAR
ncbi:carbohydrate kinase [Corynebacterium sp. SCR221107]|uniref:bifunctional ADP-dependent NAD(P)H-hydrate dehydratase/NAD(P)H-hydrate epimerase n=1 Tax=Corynebacterium sp. SCR221107 TaxID=3017361 RepID=UPI0022EC3204|nr:bifunctional ADP-dependent NAD(P)H-hydrate dehydratase/NAD(P)H-hydrate epimerase [Corynebacterium sp. SCR221107]WBT08876.1 carbohydrate kinase [Corynebacterium sp. SCR221107]